MLSIELGHDLDIILINFFSSLIDFSIYEILKFIFIFFDDFLSRRKNIEILNILKMTFYFFLIKYSLVICLYLAIKN